MADAAQARCQWSLSQREELVAAGQPAPDGLPRDNLLSADFTRRGTYVHLVQGREHRPLRLGRTFLDKFIQLPNPAWREVGRPPNPRVS